MQRPQEAARLMQAAARAGCTGASGAKPASIEPLFSVRSTGLVLEALTELLEGACPTADDLHRHARRPGHVS